MKAVLRQVRISPKKANLIASMVRNKRAMEALEILSFVPKKAAPILKKVISSAMANAENNLKQDKESLYIKEIVVTEGPVYKRGVPVSKGRTHPIKKRTSHITIKLVHQAAPSPKSKKGVKAKPAKKSEPKAPEQTNS